MTDETATTGREVLANLIAHTGTDWEYRISEKLPTEPLALEQADAIIAAGFSRPVGGDNTGAALIAAERARQISEEGYDADHDKDHAGDLATAAASYAWAWGDNLRHIKNGYTDPAITKHYLRNGVVGMWPRYRSFWKPTNDPIRGLVKAGALIAAAIDALTPKGN